jgi:cytoskeletal protein CcmA (bactofilin family)
MWGTKKSDTPRAGSPEAETLQTNKKSTETVRLLDSIGERETGRLGSSLRVRGEITGTEDLVIDGSIEGSIQLDKGKLTIGPTAKVMAGIRARDVVVHGYVKGNVQANGKIEIRKDGSVIGNLTTAQIMIEDGANFKGSIEIDNSATKEVDKGVTSRAASAGAAGRV